MSGHSHWKQVQRQKGVTDQKRGQLFSKLLRAISIAAKTNPDPQFNPRLRSAIEKAKENNVPQENIERAINKASEEKNLEEIVVEAYGPEGVALIIEAITDNKNRTIAEIKKILSGKEGKMANPGSVLWSFDHSADERGQNADQRGNWKPKFPQTVSTAAKEKIKGLISTLENHDDVQRVITNA